MLDLHYLHLFYEVAKEKNFSVAARNLSVNQSAVSIQIKKFENNLNTKLFNRTNTKKIELTYAGEILFKTAEEVFQKVLRVEKEVEKIIISKKTRIIIGATHIIGEPLLPKILKDFSSKFPEFEYKVFIQERDILLEWLKNGKIDILLLGDFYVNDKTFLTIPINNYPFVLVCSESLETPEAIAQTPLINRDDSFMLEKNIDHLENIYKIKIENRIVINGSVEMVKNMVLEKMGCAILPLYCVYEEVLNKKLHTLVSFEDFKNGYQAVVVKEQFEKEEIKTFVQFIKDFKIEKETSN